MARNVLLIVVDQWRADCVPHLGAQHLRTPNLDRLCREGVTFRTASGEPLTFQRASFSHF